METANTTTGAQVYVAQRNETKREKAELKIANTANTTTGALTQGQLKVATIEQEAAAEKAAALKAAADKAAVDKAAVDFAHAQQQEKDEITFEDLQACFHLPLAEVARLFGVGTTFMKKRCRIHGIKRWPFRKVCFHLYTPPLICPHSLSFYMPFCCPESSSAESRAASATTTTTTTAPSREATINREDYFCGRTAAATATAAASAAAAALSRATAKLSAT